VSNPTSSSATSSNESSSAAESLVADGAGDGAALPAAPAAAGSGAAQEDHGHGYHENGLFSRLTFEAGGGFNAPIGNDTPYVTWGGNFTVGGGLHLTKRLAALVEYQFMDDKVPGALVATAGTSAGNVHINAITGSGVFDLGPSKWSNGMYAVGGYGFYHMSTNFTDYECCDYYGYEVPVTALSITSNQQGANLGLGLYHRLGGMYGDGKARLFAEARYTYLRSPGLYYQGYYLGGGTTELIPVTLGVRF
jgi:hypothetical protein